MKKIISLLLTLVLFVVACPVSCAEEVVTYRGPSDSRYLSDIEDEIYQSIVNGLNSEDYFVENVKAIYISQEYLDELEFNSRANLFFGYTIAELEEAFEGKKYVFTMGEDGETIVVPWKESDYNADVILKNVATGAGVILICVTVSVVTAGVGAPAVSAIFAVAASGATKGALIGATIGGVSAGIIKGVETGDMDEALNAAALSASEGFKWGAITGAISGGISEYRGLKGATLNGLKMNEVAIIQRESKWPLEAIKSLHSTAEYEIYRQAGLSPVKFPDGSWMLMKKIDWSLKDYQGRTNLVRVKELGLAPVDSTGMPYEMHHIGMRADSPLAILTHAEHHASMNYKIIHWQEEGKQISDAAWAAQRKLAWTKVADYSLAGGM